MPLRTIIHLDLDAFFCAVEENLNPELRGKPFAVGGDPRQRGVVSSCSYAARRYGVRSAMPVARALHLCPQLLVIPTHYAEYRKASRMVMQHLRGITPWVEQISIDEAFLDVSEIEHAPELLARRLQESIWQELNLPCSLGVASNKLVAKVATEVGKSAHEGVTPPNAITVVPPGMEAEFLAPLPAVMLWGIGTKTAARLAELGLYTIGDIARYPAAQLMRLFGKSGYRMWRYANGIDNRPVEVVHEVKSISQEETFARDVSDALQLRQTLLNQARRVTQRLRHNGMICRTVKLKIRWPDFTTITRQVTLRQPCDEEEIIASAALGLFEQTWRPKQKVRLIGMGVSNLEIRGQQLSLWIET